MTNFQWCMVHDELFREAWREWQKSIVPPTPPSRFRKSVQIARKILKGE